MLSLEPGPVVLDLPRRSRTAARRDLVRPEVFGVSRDQPASDGRPARRTTDRLVCRLPHAQPQVQSDRDQHRDAAGRASLPEPYHRDLPRGRCGGAPVTRSGAPLGTEFLPHPGLLARGQSRHNPTSADRGALHSWLEERDDMKRLSVRWLWIAPTCLLATVLSAQTQHLGTIDFPTSGPPAAQNAFIRGVLLLHSFEYQDAARAFREAQRIDPGFALAYWGEALTYTHPLWDEQDVNAARASLLRLGPTSEARRAKAPTPRERAYLDAVEILYGDGPKARRDTAYSRAMERLVARFPTAREAQVFYAASLLGLGQGVRNVPTYMRAAAIVGRVFRDNPDHPGAAHLLIHCYDDPIHAPLGLAAARAYSKIAPDAAHAQHMTTHIFLALGMWDEVVSQNEIASGRDSSAWTPHHYTWWLGYGYLEQGRYGDALRHLERMRRNADWTTGHGLALLAQMRADYVINTQRWDSPSLQWRIDLTHARSRARAEAAFVAGFSALKRGDRAAAADARADLT